MPQSNAEELLSAKRHGIRPLEITLIILSALFAFGYSFKLPLYPVFNEADHLIFIYEGWRMSNGEWLYRDVFEFTFPGSQSYYCVLFLVFGSKFWVAGATTVLIAAACCWITLRVSREVIHSSLYLLPAVIFIFFGFRWWGIDPSHRMFSPVFIMAAVLMVILGTNARRLVWAGFFCALASFFTQQRGLVVAAGITVFLLIEAKTLSRPLVVVGKQILLLGFSFLLSLVVLCLPFIIAAGPRDFFRSTVEFPLFYYRLGAPNHFGIYFVDLGKSFEYTSLTGLFALLPTLFYAVLLPLAAIAASVWVIFRRGNWSHRRLPVLLALVTVASLLSTAAPNQGRMFQISMPMLVLVAWCLGELVTSETLRRRVVFTFSAFAILLSFAQVTRFQTHWDFILWETPTGTLAVVPTEQFERYQWLDERLEPGDIFFEVYEPFIYFPMQLKNPTRFGQVWPSGYTRPEHIAEVVADLEHSQPDYILWDNSYDLPHFQRPPGDNTAPLSEFVNQYYSPVGKVYEIAGLPIQVWERKDR